MIRSKNLINDLLALKLYIINTLIKLYYECCNHKKNK